MKKLCVTCRMIALLIFPCRHRLLLLRETNPLFFHPKANVDFYFVILMRPNNSVSAGLDSSLVCSGYTGNAAKGEGERSGAYHSGLSGNTTSGELIYIYQFFPGVPTSAYNIGITPVSLRISSGYLGFGLMERSLALLSTRLLFLRRPAIRV